MGAQQPQTSNSSAFVGNFGVAQKSKLSVLQASALRPAPVASVRGSFGVQQRQSAVTMNAATSTIQKQGSKADQKTSEPKHNQHFVLDQEFANQSVGTTIDDIFSNRRDIQSFRDSTPVDKSSFKGIIEEVFHSPNEIYASDLMPSQMQQTTGPTPVTKQMSQGTFEKWADTYQFKTTDMSKLGFQKKVKPVEYA